jgi:glycosyltransferase involved in cell wall biosynthesis
MKVILGVPEYPPYHIGGGGEIFKNLAESYKKLGHEVVVVYGFYPTKSFFENIKDYKKSGIKFYQVPELPYYKRLPYLRIRMPINLQSTIKLYGIIKKEKPDAAHLHGYGFIFIDTLALFLKLLKIKYIVTIHGWPIKQERSHFLIKYFFNLYLKTFSYSTLKNANQITCVSAFLSNKINKRFQGKTHLIFNGFNLNNYKNNKMIDIRKKHQIDNKTKIILSLGRIAYIKGYQEIIKILPLFIKSGTRIKYLIAGDDEGYKKDLQELITRYNLTENIEFVGFLENIAKVSYLKQSNYIAIPSLIEGFGLVALEGALFNKPIIAGKYETINELLKNYPKRVSLTDRNMVLKLKKLEKIKSNFNFSRFDGKQIAINYLNLLKS